VIITLKLIYVFVHKVTISQSFNHSTNQSIKEYFLLSSTWYAGPWEGHSERLIFPYKTKAFKTGALAGWIAIFNRTREAREGKKEETRAERVPVYR